MSILKRGVVILVSIAMFGNSLVVVPASAAVSKVPTSISVFNAVYKNIPQFESANVDGDSVFKPLPKGDVRNNNIGWQIMSAADISKLLKLLQKNATTPPRYVKMQTYNDEQEYVWKTKLTLRGAVDSVKIIAPYVDTADFSSLELTSLKPTIKNIGTPEVTVYVRTLNNLPWRVVLSWTTFGKTNAIGSMRTTVGLNFSDYNIKETNGAAPVVVQPVVVEKIISQKTTTPASSSAQVMVTSSPNSSVVNSPAPTHAVDAFGNGGVVSVPVSNVTNGSGRDQQRLNDLRALQTALELYYNDQGSYPGGSGVVLGGASSACLNAEGWQSSGSCPYPYMTRVPADPANGSYIYNGSGFSYGVLGRLEGTVSGLTGNIQLTPAGISNR